LKPFIQIKGQKLHSGSKNTITILIMVIVISLLTTTTNVYSREQAGKRNVKSFLPVVSLAPGVFNFIGDVGYTKANEPFFNKSGFQIELQLQTKSRISFAATLLSGKVYGEEQDRSKALNFQSSIVAEGIMVRYDFINKKRSDQILIPYVTAGVEYVIFHSFADLKDAEGNTYHYWSDGSVRNLAQNDTGASSAIKIHRDYKYETDLRDANLDGFGKYSQAAIGFPIGAGVRFVLSPKVSLHFSSVWHLVGSDLIDGVTEKSNGIRKGNAKNDNLIFSSVSLRFDLAAQSETKRKNIYSLSKSDLKDVDFKALAYEDSDMDGIPDIEDDSSATPSKEKVDARGKPIDKDDDGIPDYRDLEPNSAPNAVVTVDGVTITEEMIEEKFLKDSLAALPAIVEYVQSYDRLIQRKPELEKSDIEKLNLGDPSRAKVPPLYRRLDTDANEYISPKEISIAIDEYMAGKSPYSIPEFYNLIDFFFLQK